jgi:hypothetical protein
MEENRARFGSNCKMLAYQAQSPEFKTWVSPKKKKILMEENREQPTFGSGLKS